MTEKGIDMKYLPVLVVVALLTASCGKKPSRDFITQQPADSTKLVMIFEVPAGVSAAACSAASRDAGKYTLNDAPRPTSLYRLIRPPWFRTMAATVDKPRPVPFPSSFVVKKGSKTLD